MDALGAAYARVLKGVQNQGTADHLPRETNAHLSPDHGRGRKSSRESLESIGLFDGTSREQDAVADRPEAEAVAAPDRVEGGGRGERERQLSAERQRPHKPPIQTQALSELPITSSARHTPARASRFRSWVRGYGDLPSHGPIGSSLGINSIPYSVEWALPADKYNPPPPTHHQSFRGMELTLLGTPLSGVEHNREKLLDISRSPPVSRALYLPPTDEDLILQSTHGVTFFLVFLHWEGDTEGRRAPSAWKDQSELVETRQDRATPWEAAQPGDTLGKRA